MEFDNKYGLKNILPVKTNFSYCSNHLSEQLNVTHTKKEKHNIERHVIRSTLSDLLSQKVPLSITFKLKI